MSTVARARALASLVRLSHTVFAMPFALASLLLVRARPHAPLTPFRVLAVVLAVAAARTAAMAFNRFVDREIDARNPRTATREIPRGEVSPASALALVLLASTVFVGASLTLGRLPGLLALPVLGILLGYSLSKRFTWVCHLWLGIALGLAPGGAWIAAGASPSWGVAALMSGVAAWVAGFDVLYALADEEFDRAQGLFSIPVRFGALRAIAISRVLHAIAVLSFAVAGALLGRRWAYFAGVLFVAALLAYEHSLVRPGDLSKLGRAFFDINGYVSIGFLAFTALDEVLR